MKVTKTDFKGDLTTFFKESQNEPIILTFHSISESVLISYEVYEILKDMIEEAYKNLT